MSHQDDVAELRRLERLADRAITRCSAELIASVRNRATGHARRVAPVSIDEKLAAALLLGAALRLHSRVVGEIVIGPREEPPRGRSDA